MMLAPEYKSAGSLQPESLAIKCCKLIGPLLHRVESLALVPEHLGLDMLRRFCSANSIGQLSSMVAERESRLAYVFSLMDCAFADNFCTCLCLDGAQLEAGSPLCRRLVLTLPLMRCLRRLSLRRVQLWDGHPLLPLIAAAKRLRYLDVSQNSLTSEGVRRLTAPSRYRQTNQLVFLMLAGNRYLSETSLLFLAQSESLKLVSLDVNLVCEQSVADSLKQCREEFLAKFVACGGPTSPATQCNCWAVDCEIIPSAVCDDPTDADCAVEGASVLFKRCDNKYC